MRIKDGHIKWPSFIYAIQHLLRHFSKNNEEFFKKIVEL